MLRQRPESFRITTALLAAALALGLTFTARPWAQSSGGNYTLTRHSVHAGGQVASGGGFTLIGSPGQTEANRSSAEGAQFSLAGGWLARGVQQPLGTVLFEDGFE